MKRLLICSLLFTSMNTFGQSTKSPIEKIKFDIDFYQKYLTHCKNTYNDFVENKKFTKFTAPTLDTKPMIADSTAVHDTELIRLSKQEQMTRSEYKKCDDKLRADADLNHVILPTIQDILEHNPLPQKNNQYDDWECWAGPYRPAIISVKKYDILQNSDMAIMIRSYEHNHQTYFGNKKAGEFSGLDNGTLKFTAESSAFVKVFVDANGEKVYYNCIPFNHQKYGLTDVKVNQGKSKTNKTADIIKRKASDVDGTKAD